MLATRLFKIAALVLIVEAAGLMPVSLVRAASAPAAECSRSVTLANWGENAAGDIDVTSGDSCIFPIEIRGTVTDSAISQKPAHGKLKKVDASTFEYRPKAKYKGSDIFAIKATGQGPTASGTSVITVHATIK